METSPHRWGFVGRTMTAAVLAGAVACSAASSGPERTGTTSSDLAIAGLFPTGVTAAGAAAAPGTVDLHYVLSSNDPAFPGPNAVAVAPNPAWTPDTTTSSWISIRVNRAGAANAIYTYTTTFTLAANPATATLAGTWAADDSVSLSLNGTVVAQQPATAYVTPAPFTVPAGSPFVVGTNTLAFATVNSGGGPTGLQVLTLTGNVAQCTDDAQCTTAEFCDTATDVCTPKLANGVAVPTLTGHTPPLTGTCTTAVGTAVCVAGVCDVKDNDCGLANGDGPCVAGAAPVCRSGMCSVAKVCEPVGGCETDADCLAGMWCDESTTTCTATLANGVLLPTDPPHANPTLNGTCTVPAATLVCVSAVCDVKDNECGFADGDGPCTTADGPLVCRSGVCSTVGVCEPPGGCASDGDCSAGRWCDESTATCTAKLANGVSLPIDPPHTNPVLDGECVPAAAALVCASAVCDIKDNKCGYANGDGPCLAASAGVVCRSLACSVDGTCEPAGGCNVDGDCTATLITPDCDPTTHGCVVAPDGGIADGGTADGGADAGRPADGGSAADAGDGGIFAGDSGAGSDASGTPDGSVGTGDAAAPGGDAGEPPTNGYLDGGGLSCAVSATGRGDASVAGGLAAMALLGGVVRRRRARGRRRR